MDSNSNYPPVSFYFSVTCESGEASFQEVSGISKQLDTEEVVAGGENRFTYRLPTVTTHQNLVLKRGLVPAGSGLVQWFADTIGGGMATAIKTQDIVVNLLDESHTPLVSWHFYKAYPLKYQVSNLHSEKNEIAIESMELAYTYFAIVSPGQ